MQLFKVIKLTLFLVVSFVVMLPAWYSFLDSRHGYCTIEAFNAGDHHLSNHLTVTGNALFEYAYRHEEISGDGLYNVAWYIPLVDSSWTTDKPIKTILQYESGKMSFDSGFAQAVEKLDKTIDSLSKLATNRISFTGNNKMLEFPKIENEAVEYLENNHLLKLAPGYSVSKIIVNEHFSMFGFMFMTFFTILMGFLLYYFTKGTFKPKRKQYFPLKVQNTNRLKM